MPDQTLVTDPHTALWWSAGLSILIGVLIFIRPQVLYYLVAGYLLIGGIVAFVFNFPPVLAVTSIIAGLLILIFPRLIPYLFATHLLVIGIFAYMGGLILTGSLVVIIGILLFALPNSIAYVIASYLLINGLVTLAPLFKT
jgi:hypothetical protein